MFDPSKYNQDVIRTELCLLGAKYGADKSPLIGHCYTPFYYEYLKDKRFEIKKVLEIGIGYWRQFKYIPNYQMGASLKMWRDFFPNAQIHGADIAKEAMFTDERITTHYCDETKAEDIIKLVDEVGTDVDLVIDDAMHHIHNQVFLLDTLMPLLQKSVIYVVEDCNRTRYIRNTYPQYNCYLPKLPMNNNPKHKDGIIVLTKK